MTPVRLSMLTLASALLLAACGNKDDTASDTAQPPGGALGEAVRQAEATARRTSLPTADATRPLDSYPAIKSGQQVMFLYVAASKLPPDFDKLAEAHSRDYRQTSDAFRRSDLLKALRPQLEQGIADAVATPYGWVELDNADLQSYDFERKGFVVGEFSTPGGYRYFNDASSFSYAWANQEQVAFAPVADEAVARELEAMRGNWNSKPRLRVYFFAQSADLNASRVNALVTRVRITDRSGRVLVDYGPDGSVPVQTQEAPASGCTSVDCMADDVMGGAL